MDPIRYIVPKMATAAVVGQLAAIGAGEATESASALSPVGNEATTAFDFSQVEPVELDHSEAEVIQIPSVDGEWGEEAETELDALIRKFSLESLTPQERTRLDALQEQRDQEVCPRTFEDVQREMEWLAAVDRAIDGLENLLKTAGKA